MGDNCNINPPEPTALCSLSGDSCLDSKCCATLGETCYQKDDYFAGCMKTCTEGINPQDPVEFQTPWSCRKLGDKNEDVEGQSCAVLKSTFEGDECCGSSKSDWCMKV